MTFRLGAIYVVTKMRLTARSFANRRSRMASGMLTWLFIGLAGLPGLDGEVCIAPGKGINNYLLGSSVAELSLALGPAKPLGVRRTAPEIVVYTWRDLADRAYPGLSAYVTEGRVIQLQAFGFKKMKLPSGMSKNTPVKKIVSAPGVECYQEEASAGSYNGNVDIVYAVNRQSGIAFKFYRASDTHQPVLYSVFVFREGSLPIGETGGNLYSCSFSDALLVNK